MANYNATEQTVGTEKYTLSDAMKNIYSVDDKIDLSICKTSWNKTPKICVSPKTPTTSSLQSNLPILLPTDKKDLQHYISNHSPRNSVAFNVTFNSAIPKQEINMYPCMTAGGFGLCNVGTIYDDNYSYYDGNANVNKSNIQLFTDFKYNNMVCICPTISGHLKSSYNKGDAMVTIPWSDFINNPSDYYVDGIDLPSDVYIWNGTSFVHSSSDNINNVRPCYIFNAPWLQGIYGVGLMPHSGKFTITNYKGSSSADVNTVPNFAESSTTSSTDGISTRLPFGFTIKNNTFGNELCYSLVDYSALHTEIPFDNLPDASSSLVTGEYTLSTQEITTAQYKAFLTYKYRVSRTADTRYGYTSVSTDVDIVYDGQLYYDLLSGLGMYFVETSSDLTGLTPDTLTASSKIYLGAMNKNGYTVCQFIAGTDLQNYTGYNKNGQWSNPNFNPFKPLSDEDRFDDIPLNMNANGQSFLKWYAMTGSALSALLAWTSTDEVPAGFNPFDHIIGVMQAPCNIPTISNCSSAVPVVLGFANGHEITCPLANGAPLANQGSYSVMELNGELIPEGQTYLDYEPYTKMDLYIPYCGSVSLPPSVFRGATLSVKFIYDIFSGECCGCVYRNGTFYTSIGGNFTTMQAISGENVGALKQAVINGCMSVIGGGVATIGGAVTGNGLAVAGGALAMAGSSVKTLETLNSIAPEMRGNSGGRCNFYKPDRCILYMSTPNHVESADYAKTYGRPCEKDLTLSSGMGFTQVANPVITGGMTEMEKEEIISMLQRGVVL